MGNICRSPTAQGSFLQLINHQNIAHKFEVDSAGTHAYHVGHCPDKRSQITAQKQGVNLSNQRARIVNQNDYHHYDYIVAMDEDNFDDLQTTCPKNYHYKLSKLLAFLPQEKLNSVPDPYYEGRFDEVFSLINRANEQLLTHILARHHHD